MKGFLRSKLTQTLAAFIMIVATIVIPLSGNIKHAYAKSGFSIKTSVNPSATGNFLQAVSTYDASHAWAVGSYQNTDGSYHDLIEYWNGTSWTQQTSANPGANGNTLYGVKALSATNIWAVGSYTDASGNPNTLIEHSTDGGTTWIHDTDSYIGNGTLSAIDGDLSSSDAWAVGTVYDGTHVNGSALTLQLVNGHFVSQTNISPDPNPYVGIQLASVSEHSSSDVWAVGTKNTPGSFGATFTMHYNGSAWTTYTSPNYSQVGGNELLGVTTIGTDNAWAVGNSSSYPANIGTLMHWNGSEWSTPTTVTVGGGSVLPTVTADSSGNIWAAGTEYDFTIGHGYPLVWHSSDGGATWAQVSTENPSGSFINSLNSITVDKATGNMWAVGDFLQSSTNYQISFIEQYLANPSITVKPTQGPPGTVVTVTGSTWTPGDVVDISLSTSASVLTQAIVAGDGTFSTSFIVPQKAATGTQFVNAKDETTGATAQAPFTVTRKQLFIFLQGIDTQLTNGDILDSTNGNFGSFNKTLESILGISSFVNSKALFYSYTGSTSSGIPQPYTCVDTFKRPLAEDIRNLNLQIAHALSSNPNTDIYLIGHSLGGVVAFGYLAFLEEQTMLKESLPVGVSLPTGANLRAVITLDSPIGGIGSEDFLRLATALYTSSASPVHCNGLGRNDLKTPQQLTKVFASTSITTPSDDGVPYPQGAQASLLSIHEPNVTLPTPLPSNEMLAERAQIDLGTSFLAIGNDNDFLWNPQPCLDTIKATYPALGVLLSGIHISDFRNTQFLEDEGDGTALYGRTFAAGTNVCALSLLNTLNHSEVIANSDVQMGIQNFLIPISVTSGSVGGIPIPLNAIAGSD